MRIILLASALLVFTAAAHAQMNHGEHSTMAEGVHTKAVINAIDGDTVNVSHEPIPDIGWPAMTMDLKLLEGAEIGDVGPGDTAIIMLEPDAEGFYGIRAFEPVE